MPVIMTALDLKTPMTSEDTMSDLSGKTTIVVGASRGLGHGIAVAFAEAGAPVVAVSRTAAVFPEQGPGPIQPEIADAGEATAAASLLDRYEPQIIILVAGASPHMRPLQQQTWETFSVNWETDVRITFHWLREALLTPLRPGSRVVVLSSGAALNVGGSPLSGGYAGAKATQRFITGYAQGEANRAGLDIVFTTVLPRFAPLTGVGLPAVQAYAARARQSVEEYLQQTGPLVTPGIAGTALVELVQADAATVAPAYLLTGAGLQKLPRLSRNHTTACCRSPCTVANRPASYSARRSSEDVRSLARPLSSHPRPSLKA
jgi:3-oxoacyl-[acyl-carrier protein] reductase